MSDLRMQRAMLWFVVAMGDVYAAHAFVQASWLTVLGLTLMAGGAWALRRVNRELQAQQTILPSLMEDVAFRHELWRHDGRLDLAREAVQLKRGQGLYR